MNYAKMTYPDLNNGEGCRVSLWLSGCNFHCKNCFNSELWNFEYGKKFSKHSRNTLDKILHEPYIKGLSILGGEPLEHVPELVNLLKHVREVHPNRDIWLWSGYTYEQIQNSDKKEVLDYIDYLVDGRFDENLKDLSLKFRGSSNQNIWKKIGGSWTIVN